MTQITVQATVGDDRKLIINLPDDIPAGEVEVTVRAKTPSPPTDDGATLTREEARRRMAAAGLLSTWHKAPPGTVPLTPEERMRIGTLPPDARPSEELIDEDRGEY